MELVVAAWNMHCGVDGWGRPFDAVAAARGLEADVLVLAEAWTPDAGGGPVAELAEELGYHVVSRSLATGRLAGPHPDADDRWMRRFDWRGAGHAVYLDGERSLPARQMASPRFHQAQAGAWGVAVLTRQPAEEVAGVELGRLLPDRARRRAVVVRLPAAGDLLVIGTHMSHLAFGSPLQFRRLARALGDAVGGRPAVLAGDMNLWGPPVATLLPGWRRAVRGRTWPAWRPHSQIDHVLVRGPLRVIDGEVGGPAGSDHRPVRVRLDVPA
jgi:endonuclease/exonuclease/phosphatase family metal-dependent hydrolase